LEVLEITDMMLWTRVGVVFALGLGDVRKHLSIIDVHVPIFWPEEVVVIVELVLDILLLYTSCDGLIFLD